MKYICIYKITNEINHKVYIGQHWKLSEETKRKMAEARKAYWAAKKGE